MNRKKNVKIPYPPSNIFSKLNIFYVFDVFTMNYIKKIVFLKLLPMNLFLRIKKYVSKIITDEFTFKD